MNQLECLKKYTDIVVDSGDLVSINKFKLGDVTTNPSLIRQVMSLQKYQYIIYDSIRYAKKKGGSHKFKLENAIDKVSVILGSEILKNISGKISTEIDSRLSFNTNLCIERAKKLISMYEEHDIHRDRVLIKLAATWESVSAAKELKKENIQSNLTLLFSFAQAKICAEAGVFLISPFVGRIYDWYKSKSLIKSAMIDDDPGVNAVRKIYQYYKEYGYHTIIMGASFRNVDQVLALSGCDRLTISPNLLHKLQLSDDLVIRKLIPPKHKKLQPVCMSKSEFCWFHNEDAMAVEKLSEGIRQFGKDQQELENIINNNF
ncbi:transaldolase [Buchnera aphidicola str. Bp (Baizongia pistaciae)]|uniref:Transaldolase n=1 Tax=Buchnera aphidicola subsp. Baizongia pistaciae (strain Bp) TaxID=224915 RepID=TAL_BUCBP|nr:transaldolase [Buchnera aphidicola]Q89AY3.1 RecName: Full=Transaldolase [Buchnera aphidicola str. Bp (Baizongia pistaciae)]AAO26822.1 transaldolase [Buchnera aphidicola str. Bp (Baizongia pistaciae)]